MSKALQKLIAWGAIFILALLLTWPVLSAAHALYQGHQDIQDSKFSLENKLERQANMQNQFDFESALLTQKFERIDFLPQESGAARAQMQQALRRLVEDTGAQIQSLRFVGRQSTPDENASTQAITISPVTYSLEVMATEAQLGHILKSSMSQNPDMQLSGFKVQPMRRGDDRLSVKFNAVGYQIMEPGP